MMTENDNMATQGDAPCGGVMTARPQEDGNVVIFLKEDDGASPLDRPKSTVGSADDDGPS